MNNVNSDLINFEYIVATAMENQNTLTHPSTLNLEERINTQKLAVNNEPKAHQKIENINRFIDEFDRNQSMNFSDFQELAKKHGFEGDMHANKENPWLALDDETGQAGRQGIVADFRNVTELLEQNLPADLDNYRATMMTAALCNDTGCFAAQSRALGGTTERVKNTIASIIDGKFIGSNLAPTDIRKYFNDAYDKALKIFQAKQTNSQYIEASDLNKFSELATSIDSDMSMAAYALIALERTRTAGVNLADTFLLSQLVTPMEELSKAKELGKIAAAFKQLGEAHFKIHGQLTEGLATEITTNADAYLEKIQPTIEKYADVIKNLQEAAKNPQLHKSGTADSKSEVQHP